MIYAIALCVLRTHQTLPSAVALAYESGCGVLPYLRCIKLSTEATKDICSHCISYIKRNFVSMRYFIVIRQFQFTIATKCVALIYCMNTSSMSRISFCFIIPFYLQSLPVHSANCVKTYAVACGRVLTSTPL
jgi:hypothetical protein